MTGYTFKPSRYPTDNGLATQIDEKRKKELEARRRSANGGTTRSKIRVSTDTELLNEIATRPPNTATMRREAERIARKARKAAQKRKSRKAPSV